MWPKKEDWGHLQIETEYRYLVSYFLKCRLTSLKGNIRFPTTMQCYMIVIKYTTTYLEMRIFGTQTSFYHVESLKSINFPNYVCMCRKRYLSKLILESLVAIQIDPLILSTIATILPHRCPTSRIRGIYWGRVEC